LSAVADVGVSRRSCWRKETSSCRHHFLRSSIFALTLMTSFEY
jgi:hypothetical protein